MIKLLLAVLLAGQGALTPWWPQQFFNNSGAVLNNGKICSYAAGTSTPLDTYSDLALTTLNANPIRTSSSGRPTTNGIYLLPQSYKFVLRTAGTDGTCATGTVLQTADGVTTWTEVFESFATKMDDRVCHSSQQAGATLDLRVSACIAALPSTGGTVDARGDEGSQTWASDTLTGVTKPAQILMPAGTVTMSASVAAPANVSFTFSSGSIVSVSSSMTFTINSEIEATASQHFTGAGNVALARHREVMLEWFGGAGDDSTDNANALARAYAALPANGGVARLLTGTYEIDSGVSFNTNGKRVLLLGAPGGGTIVQFTPSTGTAFTFDYGNDQSLGCCLQGHGMRDITLVGPGIATSAKGVVFGGSNGALGFSMYDFSIQGFDVGLEMGDHTWHNVFRRGMMRANDQHVILPQAATEGGQPIIFEDVQFATRSAAVGAPAPLDGVWIKGGAIEAHFLNCDFGVQLRVGNSTGVNAQVTLVNPHFENATNEDNFNFIQVDNNAGNYVRITNGYFVQTKSASPPAQFMNVDGGKVEIFGFGMYSNAAMTNFAVLNNAANFSIYEFNELSGTLSGALLAGASTGFVVNFSGANGGAAAPRDFTIGYPGSATTLDVKGNIRASSQLVTLASTGTVPIIVSSTTPATNLNAYPTSYNAAGTQQVNSKIAYGHAITSGGGTVTVTLTGSAVFTGQDTYKVTVGNTASTAGVRVVRNSASSFTITAGATEGIDWIAVGN